MTSRTEAPLTNESQTIDRRNLAAIRLDHLANQIIFSGDMTQYLLSYYEIPSGEIQGMVLQERYERAKAFLAEDLLWSNSYNGDGEVSKYLASWIRYYGKINLEDYRYIGCDSPEVERLLTNYLGGEERITSGWILFSRYLQNYSEKDEEPPIIVMPGMIQIEQQSKKEVRVIYSDSFEPPYGGQNSIYTVFINKFQPIGYRSKLK